ncbi:MAG: carboxypeptidase-like regulatory domain-containing protein [Gemmatimonadetes bacterium]|nr:carboxypeptidase-like regulatory domain-containing protein [Gemmatimonadota bacterium]
MGAVLCVGASAARAGAQERFVVDGRVVSAATRVGVPGIDVVMVGHRLVITDAQGRFRISNVPPGSHTLIARGLGYATTEVPIYVTRDTTVLIQVGVAPIELDTLTVRAPKSRARIRGRVRDAKLDTWLMDADVRGTPDLEDDTDPLGRFDLGKVPTLKPLTVRVTSFGFLPVSVTFEPVRDTTLEFALRPDPIAQRMIDRQKERIDARLESRRYGPTPVLDRDELVSKYRNHGTILDVLKLRLGSRQFSRIACIIVDESRFNKWRLQALWMDQIERVEIFEMSTFAHPLAVRIYTRDFIKDMIRGQKKLVPRRYVIARSPFDKECR